MGAANGRRPTILRAKKKERKKEKRESKKNDEREVGRECRAEEGRSNASGNRMSLMTTVSLGDSHSTREIRNCGDEKRKRKSDDVIDGQSEVNDASGEREV